MDNQHMNGATAPAETSRVGGNAAEAPVVGDPLSGVVRYLRQQLGMTQEELAQALGITVGTVSRWEKGRFRPSRLARALIVEFARTHNVQIEMKSTGRH